jgi:hypothetical protein
VERCYARNHFDSLGLDLGMTALAREINFSAGHRRGSFPGCLVRPYMEDSDHVAYWARSRHRVAARVISLLSGIRSLSGHSGLWQTVRLADEWVHGLVLRKFDS